MIDLKEIALKLIKDNVSKESWIIFDDQWFTFYTDDTGQRGHYVIPYFAYGHILADCYIVKRVLDFVNPGDEGKDKAILGVLNLKRCEVLSIEPDGITFKGFAFIFKGNPSTRSMNFEYT